jgi:hypothetical protein
MAQTSWEAAGDYFESCSCDFVCPCPTSNLTARPTKGTCTAVLVFHVDRGRYGALNLDGLSFAVALWTPGAMAEGNWSVGLITDERAGPEQREALAGIASGQAGGPMAMVAPLIGKFLGSEARPITITRAGLKRQVSIPGLVEMSVDGAPGAKAEEPMYLDNVMHPANTRLALAKASSSHLSAFGLQWDDESGRNNAHFAPFSWKSG